jgi:hypothetical protein
MIAIRMGDFLAGLMVELIDALMGYCTASLVSLLLDWIGIEQDE